MGQATPLTDQIYRSAIDAADHLGSPVDAGSAARALAYELELRGLRVQPVPRDEAPDGIDMMVVEEHDGVCVSAGELRNEEIDLGGLLRRQHWRRAHGVSVESDALRIKTVVG